MQAQLSPDCGRTWQLPFEVTEGAAPVWEPFVATLDANNKTYVAYSKGLLPGELRPYVYLIYMILHVQPTAATLPNPSSGDSGMDSSNLGKSTPPPMTKLPVMAWWA
jgi:hypothetical protein